MAKIKQKISITNTEGAQIRKVWDEQTSSWYYSVADVIAVLTDSVDARNYWKALKNRLKTNHKQLVTNCNQVKMLASDGKYYMNDAADAVTMLQIIQLIAPYNTAPFRAWFDHNDASNTAASVPKSVALIPNEATSDDGQNFEPIKISTGQNFPVDVFEEKDNIVIKTFLPGIELDNLSVAVNVHTVTIHGVRNPPQNYSAKNSGMNILLNELKWGEFSKLIKLPNLADVDNVVATEYHGLITIKIKKIDKEKNRFIKVKSIS